jgi:hypothetical protein
VGFARIARGDPKGLDELAVDALVLPLYKAKAQPMAVAGFADWRLCGRIAKLLQKDRFLGTNGEILLMPSNKRIGAERIFLFGLGEPREMMDSEIASRVLKMVSVLAEARARKVALAGPELPGKLVPVRPVKQERRDSRQQPAQSLGEGALQPPTTLPHGARLLAQWLEMSNGARDGFDEVVLLDPDGSLARADLHLSEAARRGGLAWG